MPNTEKNNLLICVEENAKADYVDFAESAARQVGWSSTVIDKLPRLAYTELDSNVGALAVVAANSDLSPPKKKRFSAEGVDSFTFKTLLSLSVELGMPSALIVEDGDKVPADVRSAVFAQSRGKDSAANLGSWLINSVKPGGLVYSRNKDPWIETPEEKRSDAWKHMGNPPKSRHLRVA